MKTGQNNFFSPSIPHVAFIFHLQLVKIRWKTSIQFISQTNFLYFSFKQKKTQFITLNLVYQQRSTRVCAKLMQI